MNALTWQHVAYASVAACYFQQILFQAVNAWPQEKLTLTKLSTDIHTQTQQTYLHMGLGGFCMN